MDQWLNWLGQGDDGRRGDGRSCPLRNDRLRIDRGAGKGIHGWPRCCSSPKTIQTSWTGSGGIGSGGSRDEESLTGGINTRTGPLVTSRDKNQQQNRHQDERRTRLPAAENALCSTSVHVAVPASPMIWGSTREIEERSSRCGSGQKSVKAHAIAARQLNVPENVPRSVDCK